MIWEIATRQTFYRGTTFEKLQIVFIRNPQLAFRKTTKEIKLYRCILHTLGYPIYLQILCTQQLIPNLLIHIKHNPKPDLHVQNQVSSSSAMQKVSKENFSAKCLVGWLTFNPLYTIQVLWKEMVENGGNVCKGCNESASHTEYLSFHISQRLLQRIHIQIQCMHIFLVLAQKKQFKYKHKPFEQCLVTLFYQNLFMNYKLNYYMVACVGHVLF
eukprot:TRINITY_DN13985_c1_g1_i4.p3 TRINITY_DN13985_c1_g1~~TRINITY_DN13985_c1_g1_i4.p3  ORF type:complete len:214 (-),score=-9.36 TRINITY_DN13985_c1_g1_i4:276-917(-)